MEHAARVTGRQIRAGRALLGINQRGFAALANLSQNTVSGIERRETLPAGSARKAVRALVSQGIEFTPGGVRRVH